MCMKTLAPLFFCLASVLAGLGQSFVVPGNLANTEGNSSVNDFLNSSTFRMQIVFDASQFAIPAGASGRIDSISFRIDGASGGSVGYSFNGASVTASTTAKTPDSLSPVFADNIGPNAVAIFSGSAAFGNGYLPGASPQPFGNPIPRATSFWYMPSQGNLLLDIAAAGRFTVFPGSLDAQSTLGDSVSRVFATSDLATSGTADTLAPVIRINMTVVPEPATWALALTSLLLGAGWRRKK